jgi:glycine/D-amino acid oxidase-like deaminating enzyme
MSRPLWWDDDEVAAAFAAPRASLDGSVDADIAIVGGGYTGLWTALHVLRSEPSTNVVLLEGNTCGFGASGRNGGWVTSHFAGSREVTARRHGRDAAIALQRAMFAAVDDLGVAAADEGIDCHYAKGGTLQLATSRPQLARLEAEVEHERSWGFGEDFIGLGAHEATARIGATGVLGGLFSPHCARIQPARLAVGLAAAVERRGGVIVERTRATAVESGVVRTERGDVRAPLVVRATEGFTRDLAGMRRTLAPLHSLMIATEPLPADVWEEIGWEARETLTDGRHLIIYAQRTADDRIAFGGRGAPYRFGSRYETEFGDGHRVFADLTRTLTSLLPVVAGAAITHRWGGPLGIPRDWYPSVGIDRGSGLAWGGGYVGDGVTTSYLAGRTLGALLLDQETADTELPWVGHRSRNWEPEPVRWLGITAGQRLVVSVDEHEFRTGETPRRRSAALGAMLGR